MQPTKIPPRRVVCDSFTVTVDGVEYRPHAGEWVEIRGGQSLGSYLRLMREAQFSINVPDTAGAISSEEAGAWLAGMERTISEGLQELASAIIAWNWTDESGEALPSPPTPDVLLQLSRQELAYLRSLVSGNIDEESRKNGSSPSTNRSTRRKAARSRKSG